MATPTDQDDSDEQLAQILERLVNAKDDQTSAERLEEAVRAHPELADEIRELYGVAQFATDIGMLNQLNETQVPSQTGVPRDDSWSAVGSQLGDYELLEEIGRGGMGVVYRAHQKSLDRIVALKMIPNAAFAASTDIARLRGEAIAAARLNHPNIVPVHEVGEHDEQPWFSMQFIEGQTLSERLADGPIDAEEAVRLLIPIVEAIGAAHKAGVLHRDLKPSNIMLADDGTAFVTDFGLAKRVPVTDESLTGAGSDSGLTQTGAILGTPSWMSPEQAAGQTDSVSGASDIYSLGTILYAMLTGRPPFQSASPLDTLLMVMEQDPPAIRVLNPAIDADLEMIVLKCLQKPRDLRYSTPEELAADLSAWLHREPVSARRSTIMNVMSRLFRETHHAAILENWGLLWMWHGVVLLVLCIVTNWFQYQQVTSRLPYVGLWVLGLGCWAVIFWNLRSRSGPITAVERQIAHVWAGSIIGSSLLFAVESLLGRQVLEFSPVLGCISGIVFLAKAGMLSGGFYVHSIILFSTSPLMAAMSDTDGSNLSITLFGIVSALSFFLPGLKYFRQQKARQRRAT